MDIDLTYLQRDARDEALTNIGAALERIAARIEATMPGMIVTRLVEKQGNLLSFARLGGYSSQATLAVSLPAY